MGLLALDEAVRPAVTIAAAISLFAALPCAGGEIKTVGPDAVVRQFVDAFNAHDAEAMTALASDEIEWLSIDGTTVSTEAKGRAALKESMTRYFAQYFINDGQTGTVATNRDTISIIPPGQTPAQTGPLTSPYGRRRDRFVRRQRQLVGGSTPRAKASRRRQPAAPGVGE